MSFAFAIIIMLLAGLIGGTVNYCLPSNTEPGNNADPSKPRLIKSRGWIQCILLGIGATLLVPLFLEIAQSKILDDMHVGYEWIAGSNADTSKDSTVKANPPAANINARNTRDSTSVFNSNSQSDSTSRVSDSARKDSTNVEKTGSTSKTPADPLKNYLLWSAYCFLAAAAGLRFINNITDSVLKDKQIAILRDENAEKEQAKKEAEQQRLEAEQEKNIAEMQREEAEKAKKKYVMNNRISAQELEQENQANGMIAERGLTVLPQLGPITVEDDPQKGRFGGKSINNGRQLKAKVEKSNVPEFYHVTIWVESLDHTNPLKDPVRFYIHDSFSRPVYEIKPKDFTIDGKAMDDTILSYGAFTVGAVADQGKTLLELDLAEQQDFPKKFRDR